MLNTELGLVENFLDENAESAATRDGFGEGLVLAGDENENVVAVCADLTESVRINKFAEKYPNRFFQVGVAEQNLAGVSAGLALNGKIPFAGSFAVFNPGRNWDQVRVSIAYTNANVKIIGSHAGFSNGPDGATHQALEDIALTRVLPNFTVLSPCDSVEAKKATQAAAKINGPVYIRLARNKTPIITTENTPFEIGKANIFVKGSDLTLISTGPIILEALKAAKEVKSKYQLSVEVINLHTIKPLDEKTVLESVKKTGKVVTVEEHQIAGGMGSAIAELLSEKFPVPIKRIGAHDTFGESGLPDQLLEKYEISAQHIEIAVKNLCL
ncbi:MAG: transketolase family protein [Patescibacteria group bacterium]